MIGTLGTAKMVNATGGIIPQHAFIWDGGGGDDNWMTDQNWVGDIAPSAGDDIIFAGNVRTNPVNNFPPNTKFNSINFNSSASTFELFGNSIEIGSSVSNYSNNNQKIGINMKISSSLIVDCQGQNLTISGVLSSGAGGLTKIGIDTLKLTGTQTYTGITNINNGVLSIGDGTVDGDISASSAVINNGEIVFNTLADVAYGNIISGTGKLTKDGIGNLTLSGINTYTGDTTINLGKLIVTGSTAAGTTVTVQIPGFLGGTGTINGTIINLGTIVPGIALGNIGTLTTVDTVFNAGSGYQVDLNGAGPTYDQIKSTGTVTCDGALTITSVANSQVEKVYIIIDAPIIAGEFTGLSDSSIFKSNDRWFKITYGVTQVQLTDVTTGALIKAAVPDSEIGPSPRVYETMSLVPLLGALKVYSTCVGIEFVSGTPSMCDIKTYVKFDSDVDYVLLNTISYTKTFGCAGAVVLIEEVPSPVSSYGKNNLTGIKCVAENAQGYNFKIKGGDLYIAAEPSRSYVGCFDADWNGPMGSGSGSVQKQYNSSTPVNAAINVIATCPSMKTNFTWRSTQETELQLDNGGWIFANSIICTTDYPSTNNLSIEETPVAVTSSGNTNLSNIQCTDTGSGPTTISGEVFAVGVMAPITIWVGT